ncbi:MAG: LysR family transcriptional regulator, partial [Polaromonas sp.]|nr:LysR family transcriptional regulator [Polaromonas sp.]
MKLNKEDLNLLIVLEAMLDTRSVSKASELLELSQPSMSYALSKMRKSFGDPMFIRVKNEMQPTPRALAIEGALRQALALARSEIFGQQAFDPATCDRIFTLCMTDVGEASFLPQILRAIRRQAPLIRVRTVSPIAEKLDEGLESGAVDLAIGYFPDVVNAGIFQQRLLRTRGFVFVAAEDHALLRKGALTNASFVDAPHVVIRTEGRSQEVIQKALKELGLERRTVLTVPHFLGLLTIIPHTDLIAIIPADVAAAFEHQIGMAVRPLPFPTPTVEVVQIWHK